MPHAPPPLPKAGSAQFRELWEQVRRILDLPRFILVMEGAVDRKSLEEVLQRHLRGVAVRPGQMPRAELVGRLADAFHRTADIAFALMRELDKSSNKERYIVASIDEGSLEERLATYRALDFRRERARLIWALVRDGRPSPLQVAEKIFLEAFQNIDKAEQAHAEARAEGAHPSTDGTPPAGSVLEQRLTTYERAIEDQQRELRREVGLKESAERERSELMVKLGQRERALREEEELRRRAEGELRRATEALERAQQVLKESQPERMSAVALDNEKLRDKVRALEARLERAERASELEAALVRVERERDTERRHFGRIRAELEEQLREMGAREEEANRRLQTARDELKAARRQLAGETAVANMHDLAAMSRVGVFVDAANLSASARREFGSKFDYRSLLVHVVDGRSRGAAVAFVVRDGEENVHIGFVNALRDSGYDVREKRPKVRSDGTRKADWDMGIAMEILDRLDAIDTVILCSGDGDFVPLVHRLRREGKRVEVAAFRAFTDDSLIRAADVFVPLDGRFRMSH